MGRLARLIVRAPRRVLGVVLALVAVAAVGGAGLDARLSAGGFFDEGSESRQADHLLEDTFGVGPTNAALLAVPVDSFVSQSTDQFVETHRRLEADPLIDGVRSPVDPDTGRQVEWPTGLHPLVGAGGRTALFAFTVLGDEDEVFERVEHVREEYAGVRDGIDYRLTGPAPVALETREIAEQDLTRSEVVSAPLTLVALLLVFGGLVAAFLPLVVAVVAIVGTFVILVTVTGFTDVSVFARTLTTALGLGLGIDYSLFIVSRYREELAEGREPEAALDRTLQTAGRTVLFSAGTVAVSLAALFVFPIVYLRSFAWAGIAVVALAAAAAVVALPAVLYLLGPRLDALSVGRRRTKQSGPTFWERQARRVLARPVPFALGVTVLLVLVGLPFLRAELSRVDDRVLPASAATRAAAELVRSDYSAAQLSSIEVVVPGFPGTDADPRRCYEVVTEACVALDGYARELFALDGIDSVVTERGVYTVNIFAIDAPVLDAPVGGGGGGAVDLRILPSLTDPLAKSGATRLLLTPGVEPISAEGEALVDAVRAVPSPFGEVLVTGDAARVRDLSDVLSSRLPWAIGWIVVSTIVVLVAMLGAPLIPLKALLLNLLSLTATFGALVWIFQDGNLSGVLGFDATGSIDMFTPILMFCIAFGLSMDYEVFLLSRIKEEYDLSSDNDRAVEIGLGKTGRIVTSAALLLALVFAAIATSSVTVVKMLGVGMVIAVICDAFLIRATLVPAFMKLAGSANWWAPGWFRRFHLRWGLWENDAVEIGD